MSLSSCAADRMLRLAAGALDEGTLVVIDRFGAHELGSGPPRATMTVHEPAVYRDILRRGTVGLAEAYAEGDWDADDLTTVIRLLSRAARPVTSALDAIGRWTRPLADMASRHRGPDRARDRANVAAHYDLSNPFFELMLDETMAYSCAIFDEPGLSLVEAQRRKLDRLCRKLGLTERDHVLEVGTGWGSFAVFAATTYGCHVTTTTISEAQYTFASKRAAEAGLSERIRVLDLDYRDVPGTFDKLVSVEMIEAVDWRRHDTFFATCAERLRPDGLMALQAITIDDRSFDRAKHRADFIRRAHLPRRVHPVDRVDRPVAAPGHAAAHRRPRGHRSSLPGDAAPVAREPRARPFCRHRTRTRPTLPAALGPLSVLLRGRVPRASDQ